MQLACFKLQLMIGLLVATEGHAAAAAAADFGRLTHAIGRDQL